MGKKEKVSKKEEVVELDEDADKEVGGHDFQGGQRNDSRGIRVGFSHAHRRGFLAVFSPVDDCDPQFVALGVDAVIRAPIDAENGVGALEVCFPQGEIHPAVNDDFAVEFGPFLTENEESMQRDSTAPCLVDPPGTIQNGGIGGYEQQPKDSSNECCFHVGSR